MATAVDPSLVVGEVSQIIKGYGVAAVTGDNYAGEWPVESFKNCGIAYERAEKNKSELYLSLIPTVNGKQIELLDHRKLIEELRRLERRRGRSGKDSFDHPPRLSDDLANSVAGLSWLVVNDEGTGASGFNARFHMASHPLLPIAHAPVYIGQLWLLPGQVFSRRRIEAVSESWRHSSLRWAGFAITWSNKSSRGFANTPAGYFVAGKTCADPIATI